MNRIAIFALISALALVPSAAFGQGKKGKGKAKTLETTPADYQALSRLPGVYGKITDFDANVKSITLHVEYQVAQPAGKAGKQPNRKKQFQKNKKARPKQRRPNIRRNNNKRRKFNRNRNRNRNNNSPQALMREYQQILRIQNPAQRAQRLQRFRARLNQQKNRAVLQQLQRLQQQQRQAQQQFARKQQKRLNGKGVAPGVKMVTVAKDFTLAIADKVRVARKTLGVEYDDKGNIVEYTPEELKKRKDEKLPGYKAKFEDVATGQMVYVYLGKGNAKKKGPKVGDILSGQNAEAPPDGPTVAAILIVVDSPFADEPVRGRKKKRQN